MKYYLEAAAQLRPAGPSTSHQLAKDGNDGRKGLCPSLQGQGDSAGCGGHSKPLQRSSSLPPNAHTRCEASVCFREEQKGPAALSILLGWRLGHLEDHGSQSGSERAGPLSPVHLLAWELGYREGWILLATAGVMGCGGNRAPGQGDPAFARVQPLLPSVKEQCGRTQPCLQLC